MSNGLREHEAVEREDDINVLIDSDEDYVKYLELRIKQLEEERKRLLRKVEYYRSEIEKLLAPPLIEAYVEDLTPDGRVVVKSSSGPNLVVTVVNGVDISRLRPGSRVALNQRGSSIVEVLPDRVDPLVQLMEVIEKPSVHYSDIGGLSEQIQELREVIELPLKKPELFAELGIEPPKGVLLYGPPGCGKTLLAKAVATESGANFIAIRGPEVLSKWVGESEKAIRQIFRRARMVAPAIVFFDEIDSIASVRGSDPSGVIDRIVNQLLTEMDGIEPLRGVVVVGATNRPDLLDPALLRPGRFDRVIFVPPPDVKARYEILKIHTRKIPLSEDVELIQLAKATEGYSGADLEALVREAVMLALREDMRPRPISYKYFQKAMEYVKPSLTRERLEAYERVQEELTRKMLYM